MIQKVKKDTYKKYLKTLIIIFAFFVYGCDDMDDDIEIVQIKEKLPKGKFKDTFRFTSIGKFIEILLPPFPVIVTIEDTKKKPGVWAKIEVKNEQPFTITADLKPGKYRIISRIPEGENQKDYLDAESSIIIINSTGVVMYFPIHLEHYRRFLIESPGWFDIVDVNKKQPFLKWNAVKDAAYYSLNWEEESIGDWKIINSKIIQNMRETEYKFHFTPGDKKKKGKEFIVVWELIAYTESGIDIAHESKSFTIKY